VWSISSCSKALVIAALIVAAGRIGVAVERMPLPAFTLTAGDGAVVTSDRLVQPGSWALIYVAPDCAPCRAVLRSIDRAQRDVPVKRLVIVVAGANADGVLAEAARYPNLSDATWLADPSNAVLQQLGQPGAPTIFGMRARTIEWSLAGVLMDATDARSILVNWLST
jgi:thiol-disulfide isomerase/thioredoxin